jgi:6-phosphogluconolactonase
MKGKHMSNCRLLLIALCVVSLQACGGGTSNGGGNGDGNNPPPSGTEILYAANTFNAIYAFKIDQTSGALGQIGSVTPGGSTVGNSALALTPAGTFLYAANNDIGGINDYTINSSGTFLLVAGSPFPISLTFPWPAVQSLTIDGKGRFLYAPTLAGSGGINSFSINGTTGALTPTGGPFATYSLGLGGMPVGLAGDPSGSFLYATDQDQSVWAFTISAQDGTLTAVPGSPFHTGSQPYGLRVDPSGTFLYVAISNSNSVDAFAINSATGALTHVPGAPFPTGPTPFTQTYALTIHPSGKFLYAFNFNGNTVAAFTINSSNGALTPVSGSPFAVSANGQGDLIVDPSGKYLYLTLGPPSPAAAFAIFNIDQTTGALTVNPQSPVAGSQQVQGLAVANYP